MAGEQNYKPAQPNAYQGKQIVINSDRVLFNAKEDSVLVYADKSIGLDTNGTGKQMVQEAPIQMEL